MSFPTILAFPEELLERILALCVVAPLVQAARPQWHQRATSEPVPIRGRLASLLVCKKFYRISTPLFYHTIHVTSPAQLHKLLASAIRPNLYLATYIRRLLFAGVWAEGGELISMCNSNIKLLDITLDMTQLAPGVNANRDVRDLDAEDFCEGLKHITQSLTHLILRKPNNVYLTLPKPKYVLGEIAKALRNWDNLELADIAFRLSDDSGLAPLTASLHHLSIHSSSENSPQSQGPITSLTHALTTRPKLRTFCTLLPSLWNESILRVSSNPNLECIVLGDGTSRSREQTHVRKTDNSFEYDGSYGIVGTGLFLTQAKKHARLSDLIRAGTSIMRTRAHTLGNKSSFSPPARPRSPASHPPNSVRSQNTMPTSPGLSRSLSHTSGVSTSATQKYRQRPHPDYSRYHHPNTPKMDSTDMSRVSYGSGSGSGASQASSRSLVASGALNGHCLEGLTLAA